MKCRLAAVIVTALVGCGSPEIVTEPDPPPVVHRPPPPGPPLPPPPPAVVVVDDVRVSVVLEPTGQPIPGCRVILGDGLDALTQDDGVAVFPRLEAGRYTAALADLPRWVGPDDPVELEVAPSSSTFALAAHPVLPAGTVALFGDSDSADGMPWRSTSVDDHLGELAGLFGWGAYVHENQAQPCTSVSDTRCDYVAIDQVRRMPDQTRIAVLRFGLNDLHYYGVLEGAVARFQSAYAEVVDTVWATGATPVLVAIQEEEDESYRGARAGFNDAIRRLAADRDALFVDPGLAWDRDRAAFDRDGVHLDDDGMEVVAGSIVEAVRHELTRGARK